MLIISVLLISVVITYLLRIIDVNLTFKDYHEQLSFKKTIYIWWKLMSKQPLNGHFEMQISVLARLYHELVQNPNFPLINHVFINAETFKEQINALLPIEQQICKAIIE